MLHHLINNCHIFIVLLLNNFWILGIAYKFGSCMQNVISKIEMTVMTRACEPTSPILNIKGKQKQKQTFP